MGKYLKKPERKNSSTPFFLLPLSFFLIEVFAFFFLSLNRQSFALSQLWPLAFGVLWSVILGGILYLVPGKAARIVYGAAYLFFLVYAGFQTGYYILFSEMMWLSDFLYASEGAAYANVLLSYPAGWWLGILGLIGQGAVLIWKFPAWKHGAGSCLFAVLLALAAGVGAECLPEAVFEEDKGIQCRIG